MLVVLNGPRINAGESLSDGVDCSGGKIVRITMPPEWTGAPLSFQISTDGAFYNDLYHLQLTPGAYIAFEVVVPSSPGGIAIVLPEEFGHAASFLKIRSGTRGSPVDQEEDRDFAVAIETGDAGTDVEAAAVDEEEEEEDEPAPKSTRHYPKKKAKKR